MNNGRRNGLEGDFPTAVRGIVISEEEIASRVATLGRQITADYEGQDLFLIGILKGAFVFVCDLIRHIPLPLSVDFMAISRYSQEEQKGEVRITKDLQEDVTGRHVLIVEDIVDTGLTLNYLVRNLKNREPASLNICTLLDRPDLRLAEIPLRYVGFNVSHEFLIGYGLDYRDAYRNLPYIATMKG